MQQLVFHSAGDLMPIFVLCLTDLSDKTAVKRLQACSSLTFFSSVTHSPGRNIANFWKASAGLNKNLKDDIANGDIYSLANTVITNALS